MPARLRVLARGKFRRFHGNCANNSGVEFQVTECEHDGRRFFVRENFRYDTFTSNSGVRWGLQQGHTVSGVNILELACKPEHFEELSRIVHEADQLKRPVVRNRKFTLKTARRQTYKVSSKAEAVNRAKSHQSLAAIGPNSRTPSKPGTPSGPAELSHQPPLSGDVHACHR
jgi:hypothetical protein